jgi:hypothetical protein
MIIRKLKGHYSCQPRTYKVMGRHLNSGLSQSTLGLLKVEQYGSNAKRVNYWK